MVSVNSIFSVTITSTGTSWNTAGDWDLARIPVDGDDLVINSNMELDVLYRFLINWTDRSKS